MIALLILMVSIANCDIVQMGTRCDLVGGLLLDCTRLEETDANYEFSAQPNTVVRIEISRLIGYVNLDNLPYVKNIDVMYGEVSCGQILNNANEVTLVSSTETLFCLSKDDKLTTDIMDDKLTTDIMDDKITTKDSTASKDVTTSSVTESHSTDSVTESHSTDSVTVTEKHSTTDNIDGSSSNITNIIIITALPAGIITVIIIIFIVIRYRKMCIRRVRCNRHRVTETIELAQLPRISVSSNDSSIVHFEACAGGGYKSD